MLAPFIEHYLKAPETVLVLQGPPGTGKTLLIRAILGAISRRKETPARTLYTADAKSLQTDAIFVKFITESHDAFVIEDADHLLRPRANGNENRSRHLHSRPDPVGPALVPLGEHHAVRLWR